jgi:hypothetical protein
LQQQGFGQRLQQAGGACDVGHLGRGLAGASLVVCGAGVQMRHLRHAHMHQRVFAARGHVLHACHGICGHGTT